MGEFEDGGWDAGLRLLAEVRLSGFFGARGGKGLGGLLCRLWSEFSFGIASLWTSQGMCLLESMRRRVVIWRMLVADAGRWSKLNLGLGQMRLESEAIPKNMFSCTTR